MEQIVICFSMEQLFVCQFSSDYEKVIILGDFNVEVNVNVVKIVA